MQRNREWILLAALVLGGCTKQSPSVFVDLQTVLASDSRPAAPAQVQGIAPKPLTAPAMSMPPLSEEVILGESASSVKSADVLIRRNRIKAYRELEARLREVYVAEVQRAEQDQVDALAPAKTAAAEAARVKLRTIFEDYAVQRGPLVTRIALIAGFPDPDPHSRRPPVEDSPVVQKRLDEAKSLRAQIAELDTAYSATVASLLAGVDKESDADLTRIKAGMELARTQAEQKAKVDAAKQARSIESSIGPSLASEGDTVLPAVPGRSIPGRSVATKALQPQVSPVAISNDEVARMQQLQDELAIWLAINGYRQAESRKDAPDRTSVFIEWRKSHHLGP